MIHPSKICPKYVFCFKKSLYLQSYRNEIGIMSMIRMGRRLRRSPNTVLESSWVGVQRSLSPSLAYGTGCSILRARTAKSSPPALRIRYACDILESLSLHPQLKNRVIECYSLLINIDDTFLKK